MILGAGKMDYIFVFSLKKVIAKMKGLAQIKLFPPPLSAHSVGCRHNR